MSGRLVSPVRVEVGQDVVVEPEVAQSSDPKRKHLLASGAAFVAVQAASWAWAVMSSPGGGDPRQLNLWHATNAVLVLAGVGTAAWLIAANRLRWLAACCVLLVLVVGDAYLLRWEWTLYVWMTRGFAP